MLYFRSPVDDADLAKAPDGRTHAAFGLRATAEFAVSGIAQASLIDTMRGQVLARDLRADDRLITRDHGAQPVRWVGTSMVMYPEAADMGTHPVRIRAGVLGTSDAAGNLVLAPGQRILLRGGKNTLYFATDEVLVRACDLTHLDGVDFVPREVGRWTHLLLDRHEMIRVNGIWMESFSPDLWSIRVGHPDQWQSITEVLPQLRFEGGQAAYVENRVSLDAREAQLLVA
jgi:hypothetical protein